MTTFTLAVIIVVLVVEVIAAYYAVKYQRLRRLIASTKTSSIADVGDGFHRIGGRVIALGQALTSPYAEKGCVYYDLLVERMRSARRNPYERNDGKPEWDALIKDERMQRFGVDDGSGIAVVDLENASIELTSDNDFDPDRKPELTKMSSFNRERVLKRYGMEDPDGKHGGTLRYRERLLEEGVQRTLGARSLLLLLDHGHLHRIRSGTVAEPDFFMPIRRLGLSAASPRGCPHAATHVAGHSCYLCPRLLIAAASVEGRSPSLGRHAPLESGWCLRQ